MENIQKVKGTIESHGVGSDEPSKSTRINLIIKTDNGGRKVFETVYALGHVANYFQVGASGAFHILKVGDNKFLLLAIETNDGSLIADMDAYETQYKMFNKIKGSSNFIIFIGVLLLPIIIGLFIIPMGFLLKKEFKEFTQYNPDSLRSYLSKEQLEGGLKEL